MRYVCAFLLCGVASAQWYGDRPAAFPSEFEMQQFVERSYPAGTVSVEQLRHPIPAKAEAAILKLVDKLREGKLEPAEVAAKKAFAQASVSGVAHAMLGTEYLKRGMAASAVEQLAAATEERPNDLPTVSNYAYALYLAGDIASAEHAKADADKKGCYEAILLGARGEIAELSTSSFFCVINGVVVTPPIDTGILPGITRQVLLREMKRKRIPYREADIFPRDIPRMSEAFLSSSVRGLVPITKIEKLKIGDGKVGSVYRRLREVYAETCGE